MSTLTSKRMHFTRAAIDALRSPPSGKRAYHYDDKADGLQLAITDKGTKTFYLYRKIGGKPTRIHLGRYPHVTIEQARQKAWTALAELAAGENPQSTRRAKRAKRVTLAEAFEEYFTARGNLKPKTIYDYRRILEVAFEDWRSTPLVNISKDDVAERHRKLGDERGEAYANLAMRVLRAVLNFAAVRYEDAKGRSLLPENPVRRLSQTRSWYRTKRRKSVIKPHQLPAWFAAVEALKEPAPQAFQATVADYLLVLLFTGLRRQEAATLRWEDVDLKTKTLTVLDTKNHEDHTLPLSDYLYRLLKARAKHAEGPYVFAGENPYDFIKEPRYQIARVVEDSGVRFTPHDLRRTFLTVAEGLDISAYALKRLANHKMRNDVTAGYIISDVERLRKPMQAITDHLIAIAADGPEDSSPLQDAMKG